MSASGMEQPAKRLRNDASPSDAPHGAERQTSDAPHGAERQTNDAPHGAERQTSDAPHGAERQTIEAFARLFEAVHEGVYIGAIDGPSTGTLSANPHLKLMFGFAADAPEAE